LPLAQRIAGAAQVFASGELPSGLDYWSPLMSLPHAFGTTIATVPCEVPYVEPDPLQTEAWRRRPGLRVGLVWAGGAHPNRPDPARIDRRRSITLGHLQSLLTSQD